MSLHKPEGNPNPCLIDALGVGIKELLLTATLNKMGHLYSRIYFLMGLMVTAFYPLHGIMSPYHIYRYISVIFSCFFHVIE